MDATPNESTAPNPTTGAFNHAVKALIAHAETHQLPHPYEIRAEHHPSGALMVTVMFDRIPLEAWIPTVLMRSERSDFVRPEVGDPYLMIRAEAQLPDTGVVLRFVGRRSLRSAPAVSA